MLHIVQAAIHQRCRPAPGVMNVIRISRELWVSSEAKYCFPTKQDGIFAGLFKTNVKIFYSLCLTAHRLKALK